MTQGKWTGSHLHFVGIGGCGMSGLARLARHHGANCTGSDCQGSEVTQALEAQGIDVALEQTAHTVPPQTDTLVISAAISPDHPEVVEARRRGIEIIKYAQMLGKVMAQGTGIAVAGTHGKSTTASLLGHVLIQARCDPSIIVGAQCRQIGGGSRTGRSDLLLAEACEYDRSFHNLFPRHAIILNLEEDHLDIYESLDQIIDAFAVFARQIATDGSLLIQHELPARLTITAGLNCDVQTLGFAPQADWQIRMIPGQQADAPDRCDDASHTATSQDDAPRKNDTPRNDDAPPKDDPPRKGDTPRKDDAPRSASSRSAASDGNVRQPRRSVVMLYHHGHLVCQWRSPMPGEHMAYNAAAAAVTAHKLGADWHAITEGIESFAGLDRRMQSLGQLTGRKGQTMTLVDDYGHHPTEIDTTLRALRRFYQPKRLICVFQPHQHSRTRFLLEQFAASFSEADTVIVPHIYFVRDSEQERQAVRASDLVDRLRQRGHAAMHLYPFDAIVDQLELMCQDGDLVVTMGAGPVWQIAHALKQRAANARDQAHSA